MVVSWSSTASTMVSCSAMDGNRYHYASNYAFVHCWLIVAGTQLSVFLVPVDKPVVDVLWRNWCSRNQYCSAILVIAGVDLQDSGLPTCSSFPDHVQDHRASRTKTCVAIGQSSLGDSLTCLCYGAKLDLPRGNPGYSPIPVFSNRPSRSGPDIDFETSTESCPAPSLRQRRQMGGVRGDWLLVAGFPVLRRRLLSLLELADLVLLPAPAAFHEDSFQEFGAGLGLWIAAPPVSGERTFNRGLQHRGAIELQPFARPFQRRDAGVDIGEECVKSIRDLSLFVRWGKGKPEVSKRLCPDAH